MEKSQTTNCSLIYLRSRVHLASNAVQECKFLKQLCKDMNIMIDDVLINVDNQGAMNLAKNRVNHQRSKHIDIKYHFIRSEIQNENVKLKCIRTDNNQRIQSMLITIYKCLNYESFPKYLKDMLTLRQSAYSSKTINVSSLCKPATTSLWPQLLSLLFI